MAKTITEPTSDETLVETYNRRMRAFDRKILEQDQLYAVVLLKLNNVVVPEDYPALGAAINAIAGIQGVNLLIDHKTRATVPTDHETSLIVEAHIRIDPIPPVGP